MPEKIDLTALHQNLLRIRNKRDIHLDDGICDNLSDVPRPAWEWMYEAFKRWPHFSGRMLYPIPGTRQDPADAFVVAVARGTMWSKRTKYGRLRHDLLHFLIQETEAHMLLPGSRKG